jgi:glucokinase
MAERVALAIDLGGTQLRAALVNEKGEVKNRAALATDVQGGPHAVVAQMLQLANQIGMSKVSTVGVSSPGPLDSDTGVTLHLPTLGGWKNFPLRQTLQEQLSLPVTLENDGISAAFGEWKFGAGRGLKHLVFVTVSTGIGGGVVVDNHLMRGARGMAGHVGHMMIARDGPICGCGGRGCFEALAAGPAFGKLGLKFGFADAKAIVAAARNGNEKALALVLKEAEYLAYGFSSLLHLYSPQRLIMGGGVSQALDLMMPTIKNVMNEIVMPSFRDCEVVPAQLGDNAGLVGAAGLALQSERD